MAKLDVNREKDWETLAIQAGFRTAMMTVLCSVSARQLQRFFKQEFQQCPSQWLRKLQCRLAMDLILRGQTNKAVASELRFASEAHFCREFKKIFGASPQTFAPKKQLEEAKCR